MMIVKVQLSRFSDGPPRVLVYDQDDAFTYEGPADASQLKLMAGRDKAFFEASRVLMPAATGATWGLGLQIGNEVPDPGW